MTVPRGAAAALVGQRLPYEGQRLPYKGWQLPFKGSDCPMRATIALRGTAAAPRGQSLPCESNRCLSAVCNEPGAAGAIWKLELSPEVRRDPDPHCHGNSPLPG